MREFWILVFLLATALSTPVHASDQQKTNVPTHDAKPLADALCPVVQLENGRDYPASWTPYNCATSIWNQRVSEHPVIAPYSRAVIATEFANGNTSPVRGNEAGQWDYAHPVYFASHNDPVVKLRCTRYCNHVENGGIPAFMQIPAVARPAGGDDAHLAVVQPDGTEIDFWATTQPTKPWERGDTIEAQAIVNCGNFTSGLGTVIIGPAATAGGACLGAGVLRASELADGRINHALFLTIQCATGTVYPAYPGASTGQCKNGSGPPLGGRLWYDVSDASTNANPRLKPWEKAILNALHDYGGYVEDASGGNGVSGIGFLSESGEESFAFHQPDPYQRLIAQGWQAIRVSGSLGLRYIGAAPWNPPDVDCVAHMHWLAPCSARRTC